MKINKLLVGLLCVGLFSSCSDNDNESVSPPDVIDGKGFMSITISEGARTRTAGEDGSDYEIEGESTISSVLVSMAYSATANPGYTINRRETLPVSKVQGDGGVSTYTTGEFAVEAGYYRIWVTANPIAGLQQTGDPGNASFQSDYITIVDGATDKTAYAKGAELGKFVMFNECTSNAVQTGNRGSIVIEVTEENVLGNPATGSTITLERLAARIDSSTEEDLDIDGLKDEYPGTATGVTVTYNGCVLLNGAKEAYLLQHWKVAQSTEVLDGFNSELYWSMANYRGVNGAGELQHLFEHNLNSAAVARFYCMENKEQTPSINNQKATGLIHKFTLNDSGKDVTEPHFYYFCKTDKFYTTKADLDAAVKEWYTDDSHPFPNNENLILNDFLTELDALTAGGISAFHDRWDVKVYWNSEMYYIYDIYDTNYDEVAVYRNTIYKLNTTKLLSLGNYLPEKPTSEKLWMEVDVTVKDWVLSEKEVELD